MIRKDLWRRWRPGALTGRIFSQLQGLPGCRNSRKRADVDSPMTSKPGLNRLFHSFGVFVDDTSNECLVRHPALQRLALQKLQTSFAQMKSHLGCFSHLGKLFRRRKPLDVLGIYWDCRPYRRSQRLRKIDLIAVLVKDWPTNSGFPFHTPLFHNVCKQHQKFEYGPDGGKSARSVSFL